MFFESYLHALNLFVFLMLRPFSEKKNHVARIWGADFGDRFTVFICSWVVV